jgi:hypothetical protein
MAQQAERVESICEVGRIAGVFWKPRPVFEDLAVDLKKAEVVLWWKRFLP